LQAWIDENGSGTQVWCDPDLGFMVSIGCGSSSSSSASITGAPADETVCPSSDSTSGSDGFSVTWDCLPTECCPIEGQVGATLSAVNPNPPPPPTTTCSQFPDGMASRWCFTIEGITNGSNCTECSEYNGSFVLNYVGDCCFQSDVTLPCTFVGSPFVWALVYGVGGCGGSSPMWYLAVGNCGAYNYTYGPIATVSFNPSGPNTFTVCDPTINSNCTNLPTTVTITPC
jgi:hypothetical protein